MRRWNYEAAARVDRAAFGPSWGHDAAELDDIRHATPAPPGPFPLRPGLDAEPRAARRSRSPAPPRSTATSNGCPSTPPCSARATGGVLTVDALGWMLTATGPRLPREHVRRQRTGARAVCVARVRAATGPPQRDAARRPPGRMNPHRHRRATTFVRRSPSSSSCRVGVRPLPPTPVRPSSDGAVGLHVVDQSFGISGAEPFTASIELTGSADELADVADAIHGTSGGASDATAATDVAEVRVQAHERGHVGRPADRAGCRRARRRRRHRRCCRPPTSSPNATR